uniref:Uncharacterized protein n=1 Tax=viral metagenome TaxID=1070528 RepID=A0A6M3KEQ1_9ZZZZ
MKNQTKLPFPVVAVFANDWAIYSGSCEENNEFLVSEAWVVGYLIEDLKERIAVAHHYFTDTRRLRQVTSIPRKMVKKIVYLNPKGN